MQWWLVGSTVYKGIVTDSDAGSDGDVVVSCNGTDEVELHVVFTYWS